jgi:hypothetical protein
LHDSRIDVRESTVVLPPRIRHWTPLQLISDLVNSSVSAASCDLEAHLIEEVLDLGRQLGTRCHLAWRRAPENTVGSGREPDLSEALGPLALE